MNGARPPPGQAWGGHVALRLARPGGGAANGPAGNRHCRPALPSLARQPEGIQSHIFLSGAPSSDASRLLSFFPHDSRCLSASDPAVVAPPPVYSRLDPHALSSSCTCRHLARSSSPEAGREGCRWGTSSHQACTLRTNDRTPDEKAQSSPRRSPSRTCSARSALSGPRSSSPFWTRTSPWILRKTARKAWTASKSRCERRRWVRAWMKAARWSSETSEDRSSRSVAEGESDLRCVKKASTSGAVRGTMSAPDGATVSRGRPKRPTHSRRRRFHSSAAV